MKGDRLYSTLESSNWVYARIHEQWGVHLEGLTRTQKLMALFVVSRALVGRENNKDYGIDEAVHDCNLGWATTAELEEFLRLAAKLPSEEWVPLIDWLTNLCGGRS